MEFVEENSLSFHLLFDKHLSVLFLEIHKPTMWKIKLICLTSFNLSQHENNTSVQCQS